MSTESKLPGLTNLIRQWRCKTKARNRQVEPILFESIYKDLVKIASRYQTKEIRANELVAELFLKWANGAALQDWRSRIEFFATAKVALKRLAIDSQKRADPLKGSMPLTNHEPQSAASAGMPISETVIFCDILDEIGRSNPRYADALLLKHLSPLTYKDIAPALGCSVAQAKRIVEAAEEEFIRRLEQVPVLVK
jgi:RNA polymerase sigma factor (sigma-70 family)